MIFVYYLPRSTKKNSVVHDILDRRAMIKFRKNGIPFVCDIEQAREYSYKYRFLNERRLKSSVPLSIYVQKNLTDVRAVGATYAVAKSCAFSFFPNLPALT